MDILKRLTNCTVYSTVRQEDDEAAWLAARTRGIGGSDVGPICGVSPFTSARQIYLNKTGQYTEAMKPNEAAQERMRFGHLLEPVVADEYAHRAKDEIKAIYTVDATLCHKDFPWALANIDRLIEYQDGTLGILECKTTSEYGKDAWDSGEIMMTYIYQLNWYLWILGLEKGAFACLVGGNKFYHYDVYRNDELLNETIIPAAKSFWFDNVLKLVDPPMQASDTDFANTLYSTVVKNSEKTLESDVANDLARTVFECKAQIKEITSTMEEAQNRLKDMLQDTEIGYTKDFIVKWSPRSQTRVDTDTLKANFPEVYAQCQKKIEFRAMTVKGGL